MERSRQINSSKEHASPLRFDRDRLIEALWERRRLLCAVALGALFAGGLVARFAVPRDHVARAVVQSTLLSSKSLLASLQSDALLASAERLLPKRYPVPQLRAQIEARSLDESRLEISAHGSNAETASALADALCAALVSDGSAHAIAQHEEEVRDRERELDGARKALSEASLALTAVLSAEGVVDLEAERRGLSTQRQQLDAELAFARAVISGSDEAVVSAKLATMKIEAQRAAVELVQLQRSLSAALASGAEEKELAALRTRITRLQSRTVEPMRAGSAHAAEARIQRARVTQLEGDLAAVRARLVHLDEVQRKYAREFAHLAHAKDRLSLSESRHAAPLPRDVVRIAERARIAHVDGRLVQVLAMVATPLLALLLLVASLWIAEVRDMRVAVANEAAEWLGMPVLTASAWPSDPNRLEALIDELAEEALDARGTTLVFPVSELERPLALTIAAQLNARAQRHFRTLTGARVTVALGWQGELYGPSARRAADNADRVLWVLTADTHRGADLSRRRTDLPRANGSAAVLLDARHTRVARSVGNPAPFWAAEATSEQAARSVAPARVPLH